MAATDAFINSMLDTAFTGTKTMHLYYTGLPSTTGVEVSGSGYASQSLTMSVSTFKRKSSSSNVVFTNLPLSTPIVAWGVKIGGTLVDEGLLSPSFTPDVTTNELEMSYFFDLSGS